jgi:hypothetical protein
MSKSNNQSEGNILFSFIGGIIVLLLFIFVVYFGYLPQKPDPLGAQIDLARKTKAMDSISQGTSKLNHYSVVDKEKEVYQIPVDRAMTIILNKYR